MRYGGLNKLGSGGFGAVYRARDLSTGQFFAVKVLAHRSRPGDGEMMAPAERGEGMILPQLNHVCTPYPVPWLLAKTNIS